MTDNIEIPRETSAGACIYGFTAKGTSFLLVQTRHGMPRWGFPKGHVDPGESMEDAATREVAEESGYTVTLREKMPVCRTGNKDVHIWLANAGERVSGYHGDPDGEVVNVAWIPQEKALRLLHEYQVPVMIAAIETLARYYWNPLLPSECICPLVIGGGS